ncbi:MAG: hypothetical protein LBT95_10270 [Treponema sp.]|jgi:hypothetical protein|nr:hypothetical protein [Treponema sp.]
MSDLSKDKPVAINSETVKFHRLVPVRRVFHATAIENLESIFFRGQLCRNLLIERNIPFVELYKYPDTTDKEVRDFSYCPYHLFCDTAFDFRIKQNYDQIPFAYITWHFSKPFSDNWLLIPSHASREAKRSLFEFQDLNFQKNNVLYSLRTHALMFGKQVKPWEVVQSFHFLNHLYRLVYMSEAVGPQRIRITPDCTIIIKSKDIFDHINKSAIKHKITSKVLVFPELFEPKYKYPLL